MINFIAEQYLKEIKKGLNIRFYDKDITKNVKYFVEKYLNKDEAKAFYKIIKEYKAKLNLEINKGKIIKEVVNDFSKAENLLDDMLLYNKSKQIQTEYKDKYFIWLPSHSYNPRHSHMLFYGKKFPIEKGADGKGLLPCMEWGCKCGMKILTNE
jgi:hypothetical protein